MKKTDRRSFLQQLGLLSAGGITGTLWPSIAIAELSGSDPANKKPPRMPHATQQHEGLCIVRPQDHGQALINPCMGWTLHYYSDLIENYGSQLDASDTVDAFPGIGAIYMRLPWAFLEPEEGKYTWETFDTPAQRWIDNGQQICLRVTAMESWMYQATPAWVFEAGAKGYDVQGTIFEPEYDDGIFLEKTENFLKAMALRYDGNPNVAFIDIGHFGMWGEGHTVRTSPVHGRQWGIETQKNMIDLYCRHFKKTQLCISDDYAGPTTPGTRFPIMDYALERGVTMRDDSLLVSLPPEQWYHAQMAESFWPTMPVVLEHAQYGHALEWGTWNGQLLAQSVEEYHASYMSIHWFPYEQLEGNREIIEQINRRIGYRIQTPRVAWPTQIGIGEKFIIESDWCNSAVAPCYGGGYVCFTLKNRQNGIVSVLVDESFDVKELATGPVGEAPVHTLRSEFRIAPKFSDRTSDSYRPFAEDTYELYVSVGRRDGTPLYRLPYPGEDGKKRYLLGSITLTNAFPPLPLRGYYPGKEAKRGG